MFQLALLGLMFFSADPPKPAVAATVNGEEITVEQVDAYIKATLGILPLNDAQLKQLRTSVVPDLVDELVLKQFLAKNAPKVEPAEIDKQVLAFTASLEKKGKTLAGFLRETNQTEAKLRESWTALMQLDGYVKKTVTDAELKKYWEANKDAFDGVEVKASHILISVGRKASTVEKDLARTKIQVIKTELGLKKIDFAAAAKRYSQDPSAEVGGDLGFILRKNPLGEAFSKTAFALKPGEISDIVESEFGYHLILVSERKAGRPSQFEKIIDEVREVYTDDYRTELIAKLRKEAQVKILLP